MVLFEVLARLELPCAAQRRRCSNDQQSLNRYSRDICDGANWIVDSEVVTRVQRIKVRFLKILVSLSRVIGLYSTELWFGRVNRTRRAISLFDNVEVTSMNLRLGRIALTTFCFVGLIAGLASTTQAGIIPWAWNALFGPPGGYYGSYYGPAPVYTSGYYGYGTTSYYGGYSSGYGSCCSPCGSSCSPCGSCCSPCGSSCYSCAGSSCATCSGGTCASGVCSNTYVAPSTGQPAPDSGIQSGPPPTFDNDSGAVDEGFRPRNEGTNDSSTPDNFSTEAFRPDGTEITVPQRTPAPTEDAVDAVEGAQEAGTGQLPILRFDSKVTWRVVPKRERLSLRANFVAPVLVRSRVDVNSDWVSMPTGTAIVKK